MKCPDCKGSGKVNYGNGECNTCGGDGELNDDTFKEGEKMLLKRLREQHKNREHNEKTAKAKMRDATMGFTTIECPLCREERK